MAILPVKWYDHTMAGVPQVDINYGDMVNMLDAVLVNGFNSKSITAMSCVDNVVTLTAAGHGMKVDQVIEVAGVTPIGYNGQWRVKWADTNTLRFELPVGVSFSAATSFGTVKTPGLGFGIAFTGTNKRAYRSNNVLSNRPYLRVDNSLDPNYSSTYQVYSKVTIAGEMSDIDTFLGPRAPYDPQAPTKNEVSTGSGSTVFNGWGKWIQTLSSAVTTPQAFSNTTKPAGPRPWFIIGDDRFFYFFLAPNPSHPSQILPYYFGDYTSYKQGDVYDSILGSNEYYVNASSTFYHGQYSNFGYSVGTQNVAGPRLLSNYTGNTYGEPCSLVSFNPLSRNFYSGCCYSPQSNSEPYSGLYFPEKISNSIFLAPVYILENVLVTSGLRGKMPGLFYSPQNLPYADRTIFENVIDMPGKKFIDVIGGAGYRSTFFPLHCIFDLYGPWR